MVRRTINQVFTAADFCKAFIACLALDGIGSLPVGDPRMVRAFNAVLEILRLEYLSAVAGEDDYYARDLMRVIDQISPDSNTGFHDVLWFELQRQSGYVEWTDPEKSNLDIIMNGSSASEVVNAVDTNWAGIARKASDATRTALRD